MWTKYNPNPVGRNVDDCTVRALSKALNTSWDEAHYILSETSRDMADIMNANSVLSAVLRKNGFFRYVISNICEDCYTIRDFCEDHPYGTYVVGTGTHVVAVKDGDYWDAWDSGNEIPIYYWSKKVK